MVLPMARIPGLSALARDYLADYSRVERFFCYDHRQWENYHRAAERLQRRPSPPRTELVELLKRQNRTFGANEKTMSAIERLASESTFVVTTGQQTGLFGGPLYTLYKALTAVRLAEELTRRLKTEVYPLFYLVSEDHDFAEVQWAGLLDAGHSFRTIEFTDPHPGSRLPVCARSLDRSIDGVIDELDSMTPASEFKSAVLEQLGSCYAGKVPYHVAFARWMIKLLQPRPIVVLDASDPGFKSRAADLFERELREDLSGRAMRSTNEELRRMGYHEQIPYQHGRPSLFLLSNGRHALQRENDGQWRSLNDDALHGLAELGPERLSPKAALRPVVESALLPALCYVGGPGEIAYWAQLKGVFEAFQVHMPVVKPRAGFTLLEPGIKRRLNKLSLSPLSMVLDPEEARKNTLGATLPPEFEEKLERFRASTDRTWSELRTKIAGLDRSLDKVLDRGKAQIMRQVELLRNRAITAAEQREHNTAEHIRVIIENLRPAGELQERKLNITPFLFKYDWSLIDTLERRIDLEADHHLFVEL